MFQLKVAATIGKGTVDPSFVDYYVIFGALMGALIWNIITWYYGIPSSSSHALVGGLIGATMIKAGSGAPIVWSGFGKILAFIIISPFVGFMLGGLLMVAVAWAFRNRSPHQASKWFKNAQLVAAAAYSLGHGGNDAQKTIGIIWLALDLGRRGYHRCAHLAQLGDLCLLHRHCLGHVSGRLAHRQDHGHQDHQAELGQRLLRLHGRRHQPGLWRPWAAFRSPPPTPSPAPSSAWAQPRM